MLSYASHIETTTSFYIFKHVAKAKIAAVNYATRNHGLAAFIFFISFSFSS